jgi:hypothetical protein
MYQLIETYHYEEVMNTTFVPKIGINPACDVINAKVDNTI